jgi:hypothetical protein
MVTFRMTHDGACSHGHAPRRHQTRTNNARLARRHWMCSRRRPRAVRADHITSVTGRDAATKGHDDATSGSDAATAELSAVITADSATAGAAGSHAPTAGRADDNAASTSTAGPNSHHSATFVAATTATDLVKALATTHDADASDNAAAIELRQRIYHSSSDRAENPHRKEKRSSMATKQSSHTGC